MERESVERSAREVVVGQGLRCINRLLIGIETRFDLVSDHARRQGVIGLRFGFDCSLSRGLASSACCYSAGHHETE